MDILRSTSENASAAQVNNVNENAGKSAKEVSKETKDALDEEEEGADVRLRGKGGEDGGWGRGSNCMEKLS